MISAAERTWASHPPGPRTIPRKQEPRDWAAEDKDTLGHEVIDLLPPPGLPGEDPFADRIHQAGDWPRWTSWLAAELGICVVDQTRLRLQLLRRMVAAGVVEQVRPPWETNRKSGALYWRLTCDRHDAHERWSEATAHRTPVRSLPSGVGGR
jgi:hypothetical protein